MAYAIGTILATILILTITYLFHQSTRGHRLIIESSKMLLRFPYAGVHLISDLYRHLDSSKHWQSYQVMDTYVRSYRYRKCNRNTYHDHHLIVGPEKGNEMYKVPKHLKINAEIFYQIKNHSHVKIYIGDGFLGYPWYRSIELK